MHIKFFLFYDNRSGQTVKPEPVRPFTNIEWVKFDPLRNPGVSIHAHPFCCFTIQKQLWQASIPFCSSIAFCEAFLSNQAKPFDKIANNKVRRFISCYSDTYVININQTIDGNQKKVLNNH